MHNIRNPHHNGVEPLLREMPPLSSVSKLLLAKSVAFYRGSQAFNDCSGLAIHLPVQIGEVWKDLWQGVVVHNHDLRIRLHEEARMSVCPMIKSSHMVDLSKFSV